MRTEVSCVGFHSVNCSHLSQANFNTAEYWDECFRSRWHHFSSANFCLTPLRLYGRRFFLRIATNRKHCIGSSSTHLVHYLKLFDSVVTWLRYSRCFPYSFVNVPMGAASCASQRTRCKSRRRRCYVLYRQTQCVRAWRWKTHARSLPKQATSKGEMRILAEDAFAIDL